MSWKSAKLPTVFIPHGGGPWPFMSPPPGQPDIWAKLGVYLRSIPGLFRQRATRPRICVALRWRSAEAPGIKVAHGRC
jgi:hypothetical protein